MINVFIVIIEFFDVVTEAFLPLLLLLYLDVTLKNFHSF